MKRKNKSIIRSILIASMALLLVFGLCSCEFLKKNFASPEEYLRYVEEKAIKDGIVNAVTNWYTLAGENMQKDSMAAKMDYKISFGDDAMELINASAGMDLSFINDICISCYENVSDPLAEFGLDLLLGENSIATLEIIMDNENSALYMALPELLEKTVAIDLEELGIDMREDTFDYKATFEKIPSLADVTSVITNYPAIVFDGINTVTKTEGTLTAGGVEEKCTILEVSLTEKELTDIAISILTYAKDDAALDNIVNSFISMYEGTELEEELKNGWAEAKASMQDTIDEINAEYDSLTDEVVFTFTDYVNSSSEIIGRKIVLMEEGEETAQLAWTTANDGKATGFELSAEAEYGDSFIIEGSSTSEKDLINGSYTVTTNDKEVLYIDVTDLSVKDADKGISSGTIDVSLSNDIMAEADVEELEEITSVFGSNITFRIKFDSEKEKASLAFSMMGVDSEFVSMIMDYETIESTEITLPDSASVTDDPTEWIADLDINTLLERLENAGVPEDIMSLLYLLLYYGM